MFLPLISGATLVIPGHSAGLAGIDILPWLANQRITLLHTVPSIAESWLSAINDVTGLEFSLRFTFFAGEALTGSLIDRWRTYLAACDPEIVNLYGPTETTLATCYYRVPGDWHGTSIAPIGRPIPGSQAYIMSPSGTLCDTGERGEIVIRSAHASLGYLNSAGHTAQRFAPNPYRSDPRDLLFHTGDIGRWSTHQLLEIFGRTDNQLKLRGVKIHPEEVEAALRESPHVRHAAVTISPREPGTLAAIIVAATADPPSPHALRQFLRGFLPESFIPGRFTSARELPLLPNGKLDRVALPALATPERDAPRVIIPPQNELQAKLCQLWEECLEVFPMSIEDDFFDLGGHSLLATRLVSRIRAEIGADIAVRAIFEAPTITQLSRFISDAADTRSDNYYHPPQPISRVPRGAASQAKSSGNSAGEAE
jgi:acyl-CoA synthetase (AMP-forming)/AMP-acid ligase II